MDGETRVEIKTIDYITNGKYPDHRVGLQELPVEMKLRCGKCLRFPNGRLLNAFLEGVGHLFNMKRESYLHHLRGVPPVRGGESTGGPHAPTRPPPCSATSPMGGNGSPTPRRSRSAIARMKTRTIRKTGRAEPTSGRTTTASA